VYLSVYLFRVPRARREAFLRIQGEAAAILREYGALDNATLALGDQAKGYGLATFADLAPPAPDEAIYLELGTYRDRAHHDAVMAQIDRDPRIDALYEELVRLIDLARGARGEFARLV
jgi:uncharacterized protein YbaA (DUF1428 family)